MTRRAATRSVLFLYLSDIQIENTCSHLKKVAEKFVFEKKTITKTRTRKLQSKSCAPIMLILSGMTHLDVKKHDELWHVTKRSAYGVVKLEDFWFPFKVIERLHVLYVLVVKILNETSLFHYYWH